MMPTIEPAKSWPLNKIIPYPKNARTHPPDQISLLASMLKRWGPDQPIVVDEKGIILKGHGRRLASLEAGFESFPVVQRKGLPEIEKTAMRLSDNQVALLAGWDPILVKDELHMLALAGYDIPLLGFDDVQLVQFTAGLGGEATPSTPSVSLSDRFGVVPFSVFNAREGWWQNRKRSWILLGMQPELGRGETVPVGK